MRRALLPCLLIGLAACRAIDTSQHVIVIPDSAIVYRFEHTLLGYTYVDTTTGFDLHLLWLSGEPYAGVNCIALSPHTPTDTVGTFVFVFQGLNEGRILRTDHSVQDTIAGIFLRGDEGTHGTFALQSSGVLKLNWADGVRSRYFDPKAIIRLSNDTIFSDVVRTSNADSVADSWKVRWVRGTCS